MDARRTFAFCLGLLGAAIHAPCAFGQTYAELTPYRVRVIVALAPSPGLSGAAGDRLVGGLAEQSEAVLGPVWVAEFEPASAEHRHLILNSIGQLDVGDIPDPWLDAGDAADESDSAARVDKMFLLAVRPTIAGYEITAREFDHRTRSWGIAVRRAIRQRAELSAAMFRTMMDAFAPVGDLDVSRTGEVTLRLGASALPPGDPTWSMVQPGDVYLPILRQNERDGTPKPDGIRPIPWTMLIVQSVDGANVACEVHSGLGSPLSFRRRSRMELIARRVAPPRQSSTLELRARTGEGRPLAGYEIFAESPGAAEKKLLGRTDANGRLVIPPAGHPLRVLYVKHGGQILARLPIVPGLAPTIVAKVADDDVRLEVEGKLTGLTEGMIDLVVQREVLIQRIKSRLDAGKAAEARELTDQLRNLPTREQYLLRIDQIAQTSISSDPAIQRQIDRLVGDAKKLLQQYLDPRPVTDLYKAVDNTR